MLILKAKKNLTIGEKILKHKLIEDLVTMLLPTDVKQFSASINLSFLFITKVIRK